MFLHGLYLNILLKDCRSNLQMAFFLKFPRFDDNYMFDRESE